MRARARTRWPAVVVALAVAIGASLWILAATHEVTSVASALIAMTRGFRGGSLFARSAGAAGDREASAPARGGPTAEEPGSRRVSFSVTDRDLDRLLRRRTLLLGEWLSWDRDVASALANGEITLAATNRLRLSGITVGRYSGRSVWLLTALEGGLGVRLSHLRVFGIPVPFSSWLLTRFSGNAWDGWVYLRMPPGQAIDRVEIGEGKLVVHGRMR